jgi:hypothetical protein
MVKDPIRRHDAAVSDVSVRERTGRGREEWFELLDAAGARDWDHRRIARWLGEEHQVSGWWCQSLTVAYEQARGMRLPGQRSDGTFEAGVSVTLPVPREEAWTWVADPERVARWLDVDVEVRGETAPKTVRWGWPDGTRVMVAVDALPDAAAGPRSRVSVAHGALPGPEVLGEAKAAWKDRLARLKQQVTAG